MKTWTVQIEIVIVETWEVQAETDEEAKVNYMDGKKVDSDTQSRVVSVAPTENME